ncbi:MAG: hypothetical protein WC100_08220 [Sterolibacterium sp.]
MKKKAAAAMFVIANLASGCASVTNSTYQSVSVLTREQAGNELSGAICEITNNKGKWFVTTPGSIMLNRSNDDLQITCSKPGEKPGKAEVVSDATASMYGNVLVGGGLGAVVDHGNGTGYAYPSMIQVVMGMSSRIETPKAQENQASEDLSSSTVAVTSRTLVSSAPINVFKPPSQIAVTQIDPCGTYIAAGEKCWWSPPGAPSNGICPTVATLKECTRYYGTGCRIGHGKSLPGC